MIKGVFNSQSKTVTFAALLLGASALISRLLGLWRDRILAGTFGASQELDVYFVAFRIPDFVYGILIMGGISAIFLPVFSEYFQKNEKEGWQLANNVLNCFLVLLITSCGILAIFTPWLVEFITPGFSLEQKALAVSLTRIMFLSPIFFGLSSVFSGVLHYFNRFLAYSIAPILYNLSIIFGILFLVPIFGIWGLAYGVISGAALHWLSQIPAAKSSGFKYLPIFDFKSAGLVKIFKLMIPRTIGTIALHINLITVTAIGSTLAVGSIAILNFSNNLQFLPIGIVGASFALASFPVLSRAWVNGQKQEFLDNFSSVFRQILFLVIPVSFLMFLLRTQIVRLVLAGGQFGWPEIRLTAASLGIFCLAIFAFSFIPFLSRVFYSFQDTKTPVVIGILVVAINISLSFLFVWLLSFPNAFYGFIVNILELNGVENIAVTALPLALSISGLFQFCLLLFFLRKKLGHIRLKEIRRSFLKIILASVLMSISVYLVLQAFAGIFIQTALAGLVGSFVYLLIARILKSPEIKTIWSSIPKQFKERSLGNNSKKDPLVNFKK